MDENSKKFQLAGLVLLVLLVFLGIAWALSSVRRQPAADQGGSNVTISDKLPGGYKSMSVKAGQYPDGFPKDLVASGGLAPFRGEDTVDGSGARQRIVEYYSTSTPQAVFELYKKILPQKGWDVLSESVKTEVKSLYLTDKKDIFQVVVAPRESGSQVALTYVTNK